MNEYEKLDILLKMHNVAFNTEYGSYDRYLYNINEPLSDEKINGLLKKLYVKKLRIYFHFWDGCFRVL